MDKTYITIGDFIDLYHKIKQKGTAAVLSRFHLSNKARIVSKWNEISTSTDFWIIPEIRERWNYKCTGNPDLNYEDYIVSKYLNDRENLHMLSIGCGNGSRERNFAKHPVFSSIEGIDIATKQINEAKKLAIENNFHNIKYHAIDFLQYSFKPQTFDVILFNSSLHHFNHIDRFIKTKVIPILKKDGLLIIFEYTGPNRLQWTSLQLQQANSILKTIPDKYKFRIGTNTLKNRIFRPGLIRMKLVDPSEAVNSESILPSLHANFEILEEKKIGGDILHILLKDIAPNFLDKNVETKALLTYLFNQEDSYLIETGRSDFIFGVYQKI